MKHGEQQAVWCRDCLERYSCDLASDYALVNCTGFKSVLRGQQPTGRWELLPVVEERPLTYVPLDRALYWVWVFIGHDIADYAWPDLQLNQDDQAFMVGLLAYEAVV